MERYTPGNAPEVTAFMARRRLLTHGRFFREFLQPRMRVLDCGCGPGTITADIAECVGPDGFVMAMDANPAQVDIARQTLGNCRNTEVRTGSVYELPFETGTFDGVFSHALFEHLAEPGRAAREVFRVLRVGGVVGL